MAGTTYRTVHAPADLFLMNPNIKPVSNNQFLAGQYDRQANITYIERMHARPVTREELYTISGGREKILSPTAPSACDYHVSITDGNPCLWNSVCSSRMQECIDSNIYHTVFDVFDPATGVTTRTPIVGRFPGLFSRAPHFANAPPLPETTDWMASV